MYRNSFFRVFLGPADAALPEEEGAGEQKNTVFLKTFL